MKRLFHPSTLFIVIGILAILSLASIGILSQERVLFASGTFENDSIFQVAMAPPDEAAPEPEPMESPEPEPTATPEPEPTVTPEPEPTVTPEPEPTATPEPEPTTTPEPEPTATPEPEPTATPELEKTQPPHGREDKITICHFPPGNPDNPQTITIDRSALDTHLAHGDYIGECKPPTPTPKPGESPTPTPTPTLKPGETPIRQVVVIAPQDQRGEFGETIYYSFEVLNQGNTADTYRLILTSELEFPTGSIPAEIRLEPGESKIISTYVELPLSGDVRRDRLTLTAISLSETSVQDSDSVTTFIAVPDPDIMFTKISDKRALAPTERVVYTVRYENTGNTPLLNAIIEDRLPDELQFEGSSISAQILDERTLRFPLPPVVYQGQGGSFTITARVKDDVAPRGQIINTATFSADQMASVSARSRSSIEVPDLSIEKSVNKSEASVGDILLYTIIITNNGSGMAKAARVIDSLPLALQYISGSSVINGAIVNDPQQQGKQEFVWELGDLKPGDQVTLRYQTAVIARTKSGVYRNKAIVLAEDSAGRVLKDGPAKTKIRLKKAGKKIPAELEGIVFEDKNGDRYRDPDEPGIPNIEVRLLRVRLDQTTDEEGEFFFGDVDPGEQAVSLYETSLPEGYRLTTEPTVLVSLTEGDTGYVEFGVQSNLVEIIGFVYYDANQNGQRDPTEPGIGDIQFDIDDTVFFETDFQGYMLARHFPAGTHSVVLNEQTLPEQYQITTNATVSVNLSPGESKTVEFGVSLRPGTVRGTVFNDANENGVYDPGEIGEHGITVELSNGKTIRAVSNTSGEYDFGQLPAGIYSIRILPESLPMDYYPTGELVQSVIVVPGQEFIVLWGIAPVSEEEEELPIPTETPTPAPEIPTETPTPTPTVLPTPVSATPTETPTPSPPPTPIEEDYCVYTIKAADTLSRVASRFTGKSGNYKQIMEFNGLTSDFIRVGETLNIPKMLLLEEYQSCEFEPTTPTPTPTPTSPLLGSAEGRVYYDRNANGQYDQGFDIPIPGVTVNIRSDIKTTVTDENGYYRFENMEPGAHVVWIDPQTLPEPYRPTEDQPIIKIVVYPGETAASAVADFIVLKSWIYEQEVVEGVVCLDLNGNNDCDQGEPGIVGVIVYDPPALTVTVDQINPAGNNTPINICETVTFRVTITNNGNEDAVNVNITNSMPGGFTPTPQTSNGNTVPANGGSITRDFTYTATCNAVSGDNTTSVSFTDPAGNPYPNIPFVRSFTVNPGAITLTKVATQVNGVAIPGGPTSEPVAGIGDVITWEIRVQSSGLGEVRNILVTETIGNGLAFSDGTPGLTRQFSAAGPVSSGNTVTFSVDTDVIGCENLTNDVSAIWGCTPGIGCLDAVTAQSSVNLITRHPYLEYTPPDINISIPYCSATPISRSRTLTIRNTGDGFAQNARINVDFAPLTVNVTSSTPAGVMYDSVANAFIIPGIINAGDTVTINYEAVYNPPANWCAGGTAESGTHFWEPIYEDQCHIIFRPPLRTSTYSIDMAAQPRPTVSVTKSCTVGGVDISPILPITNTPQIVSCDIQITYSGPINCGSGTTSDLTVTDDYPNEWTLNSITPTPGTPDPGVGPGPYADPITWTVPNGNLPGTFTYTQEFTIPAIGAGNICDSCGQLRENFLSVSGTDCCNCPLNGSASVSTNIECPNPVGIGIGSTRTVAPGSAEVCVDGITFTSEYTFTGVAWDSINWAGNVVFTEENANFMELVGGPVVTITGSSCTPTLGITNNTPGGSLVIGFTGTDCPIGSGTTLEIQYILRPTDLSQPQCGASYSFVDYANLEVLDTSGGGFLPGTYCPGARPDSVVVRDANQVTTLGSAMTVDIEWDVPTLIVGPCGEYDATVTITKTSSAPAYDAVLFLENLNYDILTVTGWTGIEPINGQNGTTVTNGYAWNYGDLFNGPAGQQATLRIHVQGRCLTDPELDVRFGYNDGCDLDPAPGDLLNPATRTCQATDNVSGIIRDPDLTVTKFPEVIYAKWQPGGLDPAQWTITVVNSGAGSAFHVEVIETLGSDLAYLPSPLTVEWTNVTGITRTIVSPQEVRYHIDEMAPGEVRKLTFQATINGCQYTTNNVTAQVRCLGATCDQFPDSSVVRFPPTDLVVTTKFSNPINLCSLLDVILTARNAGLTPIYQVDFNQILPPGLIYQVGSSEYRVNPPNPDDPGSAPWQGLGATEPTGGGVVGNPFVWSYNDYPVFLNVLNPGDIVQIRFQVFVNCTFTPGDLKFWASYARCGAAARATTSESVFSVVPNSPVVTVTKTPPNQTITCGSEAEWIITVNNAATGTAGQAIPAQYLWLQDTWGGAYTFVSFERIGGPDPPTAVGANSISWEIFDLVAGTSQQFRLRARFDNCGGDFTNAITAQIRCLNPGTTPDGDPATIDPGCDIPPSPTASATATEALPQLQTVLATNTLDACSEDVPIRIELTNTSPLARLDDLDLDVLLPSGVTFVPGSATVDGASVVPTIIPNGLRFYNGDTTSPNLPTLDPTNTVVIEFRVNVACVTSGQFSVTPHFEDCCNQVFNPGTTNLATTWRYPRLRVVKTNNGGPFDCGETIDWTIRVINNGPVAAEMVRVVDTYGVGLSFDGGTATSAVPGITPNFYETNPNDTQILWDNVARTISWEIGNLPANGGTRSYTLRTVLGSGAACTGTNRRNRVDATWHCVTGSVANEVPLPMPDESTCTSGAVNRTANANVVPVVNVNATISPTQIAYCALDTVVTVDMTVPALSNTLYNLDATISLPTGLAFHNGGAFNISAFDPHPTSPPVGGVTNLAAGPMPDQGATTFSFNNTDPLLGGHLADSVSPDTTVRIQFNVSSSCFNGGNISVQLAYDDCCNNHYTPGVVSTLVSPNYPNLGITVTKNPNTADVDCNTDVNYTITATNNGPVTASYAQIRAYLAEWLSYQGSTAPTTNPALPAANISGPGCDPDGALPCGACAAGFSSGNILWEVRDLPAGGTWQTILTVQYNPPVAGADCDDTDRELLVSTLYGCPADVVTWTFDQDACTNDGNGCNLYASNQITDRSDAPDLTISGAVIATMPDECGNGTVTVTVQNQKTPNGRDVSNFRVRVTGDLTGEYNYTATLAEGTSNTITIPVTTTQQCGGPYNFTVTVDANGDICECNEINNTANGTVTIPCPTLNTTKTLVTPTTTEPCVPVQYDVTIQNTGPAGTTLNWAAGAVIFEETLPAGWVFDSTDSVANAGGASVALADITSPAAGSTGAIQWRANSPITITGGQSFTVRYTVHATTANCGSSLTNSVTVRAWERCGDQRTAVATAANSVTIQCPGISATKTDNIPANTVEPCEEVTYTVTMANPAVATAPLYINPGQVVVTDDIPANWEFVRTVDITSAGNPVALANFTRPAEPTAGAAALTWTLQAGAPQLVLNPGQSFVLRYIVRPLTSNSTCASPPFQNSATVRGQDRCGSIYQATAQADQIIVECPVIQASKTDNIGDDTVEPCEEVTYAVTMTNDAIATAPLYINPGETVVKDSIPANWEFVRTVSLTVAGVDQLANFTRPTEPTAGTAPLTWTLQAGAPQLVLNPGQSLVLTYVVRPVTTDANKAVCGTVFQNSATVQARDNCHSIYSQTVQADALTVICPSLHVNKTGNTVNIQPCQETDNPLTPGITEPLTYTIEIRNTGDPQSTIRVDRVIDVLDTGWYVVSSTVTLAGIVATQPAAGATGTLVWTFNPGTTIIAPAGIITITLQIAMDTNVNPSACDATYRFANTVTIEAYDSCGARLTLDATSDPTADPVAVDCPALQVISRAEPPGNLQPCEEVTYTITVRNTGGATSTLQDIRIGDTIPQDFQLTRISVTRDGNPLTYNSHYSGTDPTTLPINGPANLEWFFDSVLPNPVFLSPGEVITIQFVGYFTENACGTTYQGTIVATAGADQCGLPKQPTNDSVLTIPTANIVCPEATLTKELNGSTSISAGDQVKYTLTVDNKGGSGSYLYDVEVTDELPSGWRLISSTVTGGTGTGYIGPAARATGTLTWKFSGKAIEAGKPLQITIIVSPDETVCGRGEFCNKASLKAKTSCDSPIDVKTAMAPCITVLCPTPTPGGPTVTSSLSLLKSVNHTSVQPGQIVQYTVTINNSTDTPVYNAEIQDSLPQGFSYVAGTATVSSGSVSVGGSSGKPGFTIDVIPARGSVVLTYSVLVSKDVPAGQYSNTASISGLPPASTTVRVTETPGSLGGERFGKWREEVGERKPCIIIPAEVEEPWFITDIAMYAASEMQMVSHPFIQWSEENGLAIERTLLAPTGVREFGSETLEFSLNNINTVMTNSGIGLYLKYAPVILEGAKAKNVSPEQYLAVLLQEFAQHSNLQAVPRGLYPVFIEYAEGDPRYTTSRDINDWNTLLWDSRSFNKHLIPSAYGQTLLRQVLLIKEFLATNHGRDGKQDVAGEFPGVDDVKGFLGILAAEEIVNKLWFMQQYLLHQKESQTGTFTVQYFPYQTIVDSGSLASEKPDIRFVNKQSRLFDQLSLLWGLSELMLLTDPASPEPYHQVFQQEMLAPGVQNLDFAGYSLSTSSVHDLARHLADIVFATILEFHYSSEEQTLIDVFPVDCEGEEQDPSCTPEVSTVHLGLSLVALERYYEAKKGDSRSQKRILELIRSAADYLVDTSYDPKDGGFFETQNLLTPPYPPQGGNPETRTSVKTLTAQMAGIRGLLAAYKITQDQRYRARAFEAYRYAEKILWNEDIGVYKDRVRRSVYRYTPLSVGTVVGALRELIYEADTSQQAVQITERMKTFGKQIVKYAGLQLSEVKTGSHQEFLIPVGGMSVIRNAQALDSPFGLAPVLGSEIVLNQEAIAALHAKRPTDACEQARNSFRSDYYYTDIGMYAASELAQAHRQFWKDEFSFQTESLDAQAKNRNSEILNPASLEATGAKSRDFSDHNLIHIQTKSSLGIRLEHGPVIQRAAEAQNMAEKDYVKALLEQYAKLTGLEDVPDHLSPIFLEFEGGVPEIEYGKDSEQWIESNMDKSLVPSALGQTLVRQVLWIKEVLSNRHDQQNRICATGEYLGRSAEEGFLGLLVAQAVANKLIFLKETMLVPLESEEFSTPSGYYIPHRFEVDFDDNTPKSHELEDKASYLFDQVSLLWGVSEFKNLSKSGYTDIFGEGKLISGNYHDLAKELVRIILDNLETLHWNSTYQTFYDVNTLHEAKQSDVEENETQKNVISTDKAALAIIALESIYRNFPEEPALQARAKQLLLKQVEFLSQHLYREEDGAIYNGASLNPGIAGVSPASNADGTSALPGAGETPALPGVKPFRGLKTLLAHTAAIRSFLIAYQITGEQEYLTRAKRTFEFLDRTFWDEYLQVYRSAIGGSRYHYTPLNVGMTVGALRELLAMNGPEYVEFISDHLSKFFEHVVERIGLQLSEQRHFLELLGQPRTLAPVIASDLMIQPLGSGADIDIPQPGSTLIYRIEFPEDSLPCDPGEAYVEDVLPEGVTFVRSVPTPVSFDGKVLRWLVSDIIPDENGLYTIRFKVTVDPLITSGSQYDEIVSGIRKWDLNNCASLWCQGAIERQIGYDCEKSEIKLPQLGIEKSLGTSPAISGEKVEFEVVVTNLSEVTAYTVTIRDQLPAGFIYIENSARSRDVPIIDLDDKDPLVWVLEDLEPQKSIRLTYKVALDPKLEEVLYLTAVKVYAMDRSGFPFETNEFALDVKVERAMMLDIRPRILEQEKGKQIQAGTPFTVNTSIENIGSVAMTDSRLIVTLPEGMRYVQASSQINNTSVSDPKREGQNLIWQLYELPVEVQRTLQYMLYTRERIPGKPQIIFEIQGTTDTGTPYQSKQHALKIDFSED